MRKLLTIVCIISLFFNVKVNNIDTSWMSYLVGEFT